MGRSLTWSDLLQEFRLVILSEAGTGKTAEIRHITTSLRKDGKAAFFLRPRHIVNDFEGAFEVGCFEKFKAWLASGSEGWLLLDSVNEARLRSPNDFELAIRKFGQHITTALPAGSYCDYGQDHCVAAKDRYLEHCTRCLPYRPPTVTPLPADDQPTKGSVERSLRTEDRQACEEKPLFRFVALDDLDRDQIRTFASAKGVQNTQAFLDAVERADAWSFTARPQDLQELVDFWNDRAQIGSCLELMQNSIDRPLLERDQGRADAHPLSPLRTREGARLIAAAATLVKEPAIRIPDGADNSVGIAAAEILPDWNDRDRMTLLSRPIFDEAIYGGVRFHHRSVREFLTAEWLSELLKAQRHGGGSNRCSSETSTLWT